MHPFDLDDFEAKKLWVVQGLLHSIFGIPTTCNGVLLSPSSLFDADQLPLEFTLQGYTVWYDLIPYNVKEEKQ